MNEVKFCRDCKHSRLELGAPWNLLCTHPEVTLALASAKEEGSSARSERARFWALFSSCGRVGKLWEQK